MNGGDENVDEVGTKDRADAPRKVEKCDGGSGVFGGELGSAKIDGRVGQPVAETDDADHKGGDVPGAEAKKRKTQKKSDEAGSRDFGETVARQKNAGKNDAEGAEEILRSEEETGLGVCERPAKRKGRQNRAEKRGDYADEDEAQMKKSPFLIRVWRGRSVRGRGHWKASVA